ncbi:Uncharacterised protein [Salmonella enterica subsp. enterica serovar Typhimurium str. DT104]|nr:Uncharacterised protein [Salmonella enterica subsp. enterica serovar Typhimurium str. DT104]CQM44459.1 Uncharacterised protein [Salmonella enterica subsp. enterica serovar Typhimurium str. DT104]
MIIFVINPPQRTWAGKNQRIGVIGFHQFFQGIFVIEVNIPQHTVLDVVLKQVNDFRIPGQEIGAFHNQIRPEQHTCLAVGDAVRLGKNHLIAGHHRMPDPGRQRKGECQSDRHIIHPVNPHQVAVINYLY